MKVSIVFYLLLFAHALAAPTPTYYPDESDSEFSELEECEAATDATRTITFEECNSLILTGPKTRREAISLLNRKLDILHAEEERDNRRNSLQDDEARRLINMILGGEGSLPNEQEHAPREPDEDFPVELADGGGKEMKVALTVAKKII